MSHERVIKQMQENLAQLSIEVRQGSRHEIRTMLLSVSAGVGFRAGYELGSVQAVFLSYRRASMPRSGPARSHSLGNKPYRATSLQPHTRPSEAALSLSSAVYAGSERTIFHPHQ